jgi:ferritin-like metal-binding protein YciE
VTPQSQVTEGTTSLNSSTATKSQGKRSSSKRKGKRSAGGRGGSRSSRKKQGVDVASVFRHEVADISDGEKRFAKFLRSLESGGSSTNGAGRASDLGEELREIVDELGQRSERHQRSLQRVAKEYAKGRTSRRCEAMEALVKEGRKAARGGSGTLEADLLTITALQKMLHYSIASFGSLSAWSAVIGDEDALILFRKLTDERKQVDRELTEVAEDAISSQRHGHRNGHGGPQGQGANGWR